MKVVVLHYGSYMKSLSTHKLLVEQGTTNQGVDKNTHDCFRVKLMQSALVFNT
ncbi:MAG TPA: helix-turn-helix domain-containing protein [Pseudogracilibacillus sp.]|nr:helix-turn-helix domain-containing protein [Pseudogracilibacillus sp.]